MFNILIELSQKYGSCGESMVVQLDDHEQISFILEFTFLGGAKFLNCLFKKNFIANAHRVISILISRANVNAVNYCAQFIHYEYYEYISKFVCLFSSMNETNNYNSAIKTTTKWQTNRRETYYGQPRKQCVFCIFLYIFLCDQCFEMDAWRMSAWNFKCRARCSHIFYFSFLRTEFSFNASA